MKKLLLFLGFGYRLEVIFTRNRPLTLNCLVASKMKCGSAELSLMKKMMTADRERRGVWKKRELFLN
jgi:hypothetical protein